MKRASLEWVNADVSFEHVSVTELRNRFPKGLSQPAGGFRFAVDSLLLSCFPRINRVRRFLDLGTGCGVVGLGMLLRSGNETLNGVGLDVVPDMAAAARENAVRLGLETRFSVCECDVGSVRSCRDVGPESFDLVAVNPPYREEGRGRVSPGEERRAARFETAAGLDDFLSAAAYALSCRGRLAISYLSERLADLFTALRAQRLEPKRMRLMAGHSKAPPRLVLVEAVKNGGPGLVVEPVLVIHADRQGRTVTDEAARFCPFLAKTTRPAPGSGPWIGQGA